MKPITVALGCRKGGVGKTAITASLASLYASQGHMTLIVDLDPQGNATFGVGADPGAPGVAEFLEGGGVAPVEVDEHLHVLAGGSQVDSQAIKALHPEELRDALRPLKDRYSTILLDLPPGEVSLERLGLVASDLALIPVDAHPFALTGATRIHELLSDYQRKDRTGPKAWAMVLSKLDTRRRHDAEMQAVAAQVFPGIPALTMRQDINVGYALAERTPLLDFKSKPACLDDLLAIQEWIDGQR